MFPIRLEQKTGAKHTDNKQTPYQTLHFFMFERCLKAPDLGEQHHFNSLRRVSYFSSCLYKDVKALRDAPVEQGAEIQYLAQGHSSCMNACMWHVEVIHEGDSAGAEINEI